MHHAISCMVSHSDLLLRLPEGSVECKACEDMQKYLDIRLTKFQSAIDERPKSPIEKRKRNLQKGSPLSRREREWDFLFSGFEKRKRNFYKKLKRREI